MYMAITVVILMDMYNHLAPQDKEYFRASREALFGQKLEEVSSCFDTNYNGQIWSLLLLLIRKLLSEPCE